MLYFMSSENQKECTESSVKATFYIPVLNFSVIFLYNMIKTLKRDRDSLVVE